MKWFGTRFTYANVMSTIAVFAVLGGGAYAADKIGSKDIAKKAVKSEHIKNKGVKTNDLAKRSVKTKNLGRQAVKGNKVAQGTLLNEHFADGQLPQGEQGPQGATGPKGEPGQDATKLFAYIRDSLDINQPATIDYGSGVTGIVDNPGNDHMYLLTFNRSLVNCVVQASTGFGNPSEGGGAAYYGIPDIFMESGSAEQVEIAFKNHDGTNVDTSFMVTAFC